MNELYVIVGASGVGKTTLAHALNRIAGLELGLELHADRPFQARFKEDHRYALSNQLDYLILRAEQEITLRHCRKTALMDGGLDLDFHGFSRLFHTRGWLSDEEFDLCSRFHSLIRKLLPSPDLIISLHASPKTVRARLGTRDRINIASSEDSALLNQYIEDWLHTLPPQNILRLDVSNEGMDYSNTVQTILQRIHASPPP